MTLPKLALLAAAAGLALAGPARAQMDHRNMPGMTMPMPAKKPAAKKPAAKKPAAKKPAAKKPAAKKPGTEKPAANKPAAAQPMPAMPGHDMPTMPGHDMSTMPGHDMSTMAPAMPAEDRAPAGTDLPAGKAPPPPVPADHAADAIFGADSMATSRHHLRDGHGAQKHSQLFVNVLEYQARKGRDGYEWDGEAWYGGDINRLWLKSEGEGASGIVERAEGQLLYSRAVDPYFNFQAGVRYDFLPNPSRVYVGAGVEGLAPNFFELEAFAFLSNKGELMARAEGYYDQRITQRLILQPRAELNFAAQSSRDIGAGAGLSDAEVGVRLRYDLRREFAPYVGVQYQRAFGKARNYLREEGERAAGWEFVVGVRTWL